MRRFGQLSVDEQAIATQLALDQLTADPELRADPALAPRLAELAQRRARDAFYVDAGDRLVHSLAKQPSTP